RQKSHHTKLLSPYGRNAGTQAASNAPAFVPGGGRLFDTAIPAGKQLRAPSKGASQRGAIGNGKKGFAQKSLGCRSGAFSTGRKQEKGSVWFQSFPQSCPF